ncbi:hypothetical protein Q3G72_002983 [Acer saccharum]|nr:hypothetical protein Q3G72_002983 [Acer saccharum]
MSRFHKGRYICDEEDASDGSSSNQGENEKSDNLDNEIAHLTEIRSRPHKLLTRPVPGRLKLSVPTLNMLVGQEVNSSGRGRFSAADSCHIMSRFLPVHGPRSVDQMKSRVYVLQFSADGSLFVAGCQGSHIRIYNVDRNWQIQKNIQAKSLRWTITDTSISPDRRFLEIHDGLDFSVDGDDDDDEFGIFSVKFSTDGKELVAAGSDNSIYVYDLQADRCTLRVPARRSDVNTVCFADETGHLIFSGSDDKVCKVWDRRCFITNGQASGLLMGHLEGITFLDSRRDGRYFISNGKDQTTKLWDIRKMSSNTSSPLQVYPRMRIRETKMATSSTARLSFRLAMAVIVILVLFYVGRPLYWKISATVHEIRQNKQTVKQGISQIVYEAQKSVGWWHDESDSGDDQRFKKVVLSRRLLF